MAPRQFLLGVITLGDYGTGANVTVVDNGDGTVTLANGIASILIVKASSRLNSVLYTHTSNGNTVTTQMLDGSGEYYYGGTGQGNGTYIYSLATDPATNGGNYADIEILSTSATNGVQENHFSMLRGSPGFYSTAVLMHRAQDAASSVGAWGVITRVPAPFNWVSADAARNFYIGTQPTTGVGVPDSPHEITVNLNGTDAGQYADKFIYGLDHGDEQAWGWSSVGTGAANVGTWIMSGLEFSDGGPLKRDVEVYPYNNSNNSILTEEVGQGSDATLAAGEVWTKTCGPWFIYLNTTNTTGTTQAAAASIQTRWLRPRPKKRRGRIPGLITKITFLHPVVAWSPGRSPSTIRATEIRPLRERGWEWRLSPKRAPRLTIFRNGKSLTNSGRKRTQGDTSPFQT